MNKFAIIGKQFQLILLPFIYLPHFFYFPVIKTNKIDRKKRGAKQENLFYLVEMLSKESENTINCKHCMHRIAMKFSAYILFSFTELQRIKNLETHR